MSYLDDPRVYFAAERTLLAWQRSAIALMGLGFVIERFGLFIRLIAHDHPTSASQTAISLYIGVAFILVGAGTAMFSAVQFIQFCQTLSAQEQPRGHISWLPAFINLLLGLAGIALSLWLLFTD